MTTVPPHNVEDWNQGKAIGDHDIQVGSARFRYPNLIPSNVMSTVYLSMIGEIFDDSNYNDSHTLLFVQMQ